MEMAELDFGRVSASWGRAPYKISPPSARAERFIVPLRLPLVLWNLHSQLPQTPTELRPARARITSFAWWK